MALPKSTFVMGFVTLGLFGLAIRETAASKGAAPRERHDDDNELDEGDAPDSEALAEYEARQAAERADETREKAAADARLARTLESVKQLYGVEAASPGALFDGVVFNTDQSQIPRGVTARVETFQSDTRSEVRIGGELGGPVQQITIHPVSEGDSDDRYSVCKTLLASLGEAWGEGTPAGRPELRVWVNPTTRQRASIDPSSECTLTFEQYVKPAELVGRAATSVVPLGAIGQPADAFATSVGGTIADRKLEWTRAGVGTGVGLTTLTADVRGGKIVAISASTQASIETQAEVDAQVTKLLGKPVRGKPDYGDTEVSWKSRPPVAITESERETLYIIVGTPPVD